MSGYRMLVTILGREFEEAYLDFYREHGVQSVFSTLCHGTATKSVLDYLGLEKNEKVMLRSLVSGENAKKLMNGLVGQMGINLPGTGIAVSIPVGSIAGNASLKYLAEGQENTQTEVKTMNEVSHALIIVILERGYTDMVMDAAREAGARGGTVVPAKGTATEFTAKFFGVSIASEKEILYIVSKKSDKDAIMRAISEKAGLATDARAAVFSLPVDDVVGLRSVM